MTSLTIQQVHLIRCRLHETVVRPSSPPAMIEVNSIDANVWLRKRKTEEFSYLHLRKSHQPESRAMQEPISGRSCNNRTATSIHLRKFNLESDSEFDLETLTENVCLGSFYEHPESKTEGTSWSMIARDTVWRTGGRTDQRPPIGVLCAASPSLRADRIANSIQR